MHIALALHPTLASTLASAKPASLGCSITPKNRTDHYYYLPLKGALKLNYPPTFLNSWPVFQSSNLIGQSNVIANAWSVYWPVYYSCAFAQIKGCGTRTQRAISIMIDQSRGERRRTRRWLTIPLYLAARGAVSVQELGRSMLIEARICALEYLRLSTVGMR